MSSTAALIGLLAAGVLVGVILFTMKKIRKRERAASDAPDLVLTGDGKLTTVAPERSGEEAAAAPERPAGREETGEKR